MKKVYIAGAISANNQFDFMDNARRGITGFKDALLAGYYPFCPHMDFVSLLVDGRPVPLETLYAYSMAWLEASDAVMVVPGWENSKGTKKEIERATELGIPVFYSLKDLKKAMSPYEMKEAII